MKKVIAFTLILVAIIESAMGQTFVTGYVKEVESGLGIQGVRITVYGPPPSEVLVADGYTDEAGLYLLQIDGQGFQAGTYEVWAYAQGYYNLPDIKQDVFVNKQGETYAIDDFSRLWNPLPTVDAGSDISTTDLFTPQTIQLDGSGTDSGPQEPMFWWEKLSGPGNVSFLDFRVPKTTATFDALGRYELQLSATDVLSLLSSNDTVIVQIGAADPPIGPGQGFEFQYYELTLEGPDRVEGEPGTRVTVPMDVYLTAATHTVYGLGWLWHSDGFDGLIVTYQLTVDPGEIPFHVLSTESVYTVPVDGSSFTSVQELKDARIQGPWGWVTSVVTNKKEITIAPINEPPTSDPPATGHHGGDSYNPLADCAACHGEDLTGASFGAEWAPSCYDCHGPLWASPNEPPTATGHHGGDSYNPLADCAACHGEDLTGASFGAEWAPSCYDCHGPLWTHLNEPPTVDAGADQTVDCDLPSCLAYLDGTAEDPDDFPGPFVVEWSRSSGPETVTFDDDSSATTVAHFSVPGVYSLVLTADDGLIVVSDQIQITVGRSGAMGACSPVAFWSLDEGSGLAARDSSGNNHGATLVGSPQWVDGPAGFGNALAFRRVNYAEAPHEADFDLTGEITVAAWANIERIDAQWSPIVAKGNSAWRLSTRADQRRFHFAVTGPADGPNWVNGNHEVELGQWHHVAGTYDGAQIRLYIDGVEDPASPVPYAGPVSTNDFAVWIGGNAQFPGSGFFGRIDDVHIYDCALDRDEIASLMGASPAIATMLVREVIDNGPIVDQDACYLSPDSGAGTIIEYNGPVLNILDGGPHGHFGDDDSFGVVGAGERALLGVDDLSLRADGIVRIPARQGGPWTFGINSDDGFTLQFPGFDFLSVVNGELANLSGATALRFFGSRPMADTLGTINLPAGDHPFWLTYHESWGGAALEFFAARGTYTAFDPDAFRLVGQIDSGAPVPGFCGNITMVATRPAAWSGGLIDSLADAHSALSQGQSNGTNTSLAYTHVNHIDPDNGGPSLGSFAGDLDFPNHTPGVDENDFAVKVTGQLDIPLGGTYQIGFNSDDGASLRISRRLWGSIVEDATGNAVIVGDELKNDSVTGRSFTAGEITLPAGCYSFEAVMFERGGGAFFELLGRGVSNQGLADPSWHLLRVGGARLTTPTEGLQLVPLK